MSKASEEDLTVVSAASANAGAGNILEIPLSDGSGEAVTLDLDNDLPEDPTEITVLLENERCEATYWIAIASAYARNGYMDGAHELINKGLALFKEDIEKLPFYSCLTWLRLRQLRTTPVEHKADYLRLCNDSLSNVTTIGAQSGSKSWPTTLLARGLLIWQTANSPLESSLAPFDAALKSSNNENLLARLARARVMYYKKNYVGALRLYQEVLAARPHIKPDPRIGIGLCFWKLHDSEGALRAWQRSASLDPQNFVAVSLLGIYYMTNALQNIGSDKFAQVYETAMKYVQDAYKLNRNLPTANILLATYLFSKNNPTAVQKLCGKALEYAETEPIKAECHFWLARAYELLGDFVQAKDHYQKAFEIDKTSLLARIGFGLVKIQENPIEAIVTFEAIVADHPQAPEPSLILGLLLAETHNRKEVPRAIQLLERYIKLVKDQDQELPLTEAFVLLAELLEASDPGKALTILQQVKTIKGQQEGLLQNNVGVLHYSRHEYETARLCFEKALETADKTHIPTVQFNLARYYDAIGDVERAKTLYNELLEIAPGHIDAQIRLAYIAYAYNGDSAPINELIKLNPDNLEVRALYGWFLRRARKTVIKSLGEDAEQKHYKETLVKYDNHDLYSLVAMGNLYLLVGREIRGSNPNDENEKRTKSYFKACECFDKALQLDPSNAYAAQGIAIVFAETKNYDLALSFFSKIKESLDDISVYVNMGHCQLELKQFSQSIQSYEIAMNRYGRKDDASLKSLLGRAWYIRGMHEKRLESLDIALKFSKEAETAMPDNMSFKFNTAFIEFQMAELIRKVPENLRSLEQIKTVLSNLDEAIITLQELAKAKKAPFPASDLEQRALMGQNTVKKQLERIMTEQEVFEMNASSKLAENIKLRDFERKRLEEERIAREEEEKKRERELEEERERLQKQTEEWTTAAAEAAAAAAALEAEAESNTATKKSKSTRNGSSSKKKGKKDSNFISDEIVYDSDASSGNETPPPLSEGEDDDSQGLKRSQDEDAEDSTQVKRPKRAIVDSDDEDAGEVANGDGDENGNVGGNDDLFGEEE